MKKFIKTALLLISCIPFALQASGLYLFNDLGNQDVAYKGTYSGVLGAHNPRTSFPSTPTFLSIKKGSLWIPLETYLLKMHMTKKNMPQTKVVNGETYHLVGNIYVRPEGIVTEVCYRNVMGKKL